MKRFIGVISILLVLIGLFSCKNSSIYNDYREIPDYKWKIDNVLKFDVTITDTVTPCDIYFNVRNSGKYPYSNLWLFVKEKAPDKEAVNEKFNCVLADKNGQWFGKGFGDISDLQLLYKSNVLFKKSGVYTFEIAQGMRDEVLNGIVNVGIQIKKVEK